MFISNHMSSLLTFRLDLRIRFCINGTFYFLCRLKTSDDSGDEESQTKHNQKTDKDEVV